jgi:hypothetical protein
MPSDPLSGKKVVLLGLMFLAAIGCMALTWFFIGDFPSQTATLEVQHAQLGLASNPSLATGSRFLHTLLWERDAQIRFFLMDRYEQLIISPLVTHGEYVAALNQCSYAVKIAGSHPFHIPASCNGAYANFADQCHDQCTATCQRILVNGCSFP